VVCIAFSILRIRESYSYGNAKGIGDGLIGVRGMGSAVGAGEAGQVKLKLAGVVLGGTNFFGALEAERVDEGVGHVGEDRGAMSADAVVASEGDEFGDEGADLMDFSDIAEFGSEFGERVGGWGGCGAIAEMGGADERARAGYWLAAFPAGLIDVSAEREGINDLSCVVSAFHFGTPVGEVGGYPRVFFGSVWKCRSNFGKSQKAQNDLNMGKENKGFSAEGSTKKRKKSEVEENAGFRGKRAVDRDVVSVRESACRILIVYIGTSVNESQEKSEAFCCWKPFE